MSLLITDMIIQFLNSEDIFKQEGKLSLKLEEEKKGKGTIEMQEETN